jgi:hypothetical protein
VITPATKTPNFENNAHRRLITVLTTGYQWLASRELLACGVILALTLGLRAALLPWLSIPQPAIHDEFSYLLAADTYAHGRLANPPHPFWQHFESFQILQQPTYGSKYQPLHGMVLAFGQKLFGEPWIGVYLSTGLMCAAICWMLQGWIAPDWALLGALLCVLRVGVLSYWMNSYLAGALPGMGGAVALGALVRIWRRRQFGHSVTWAVGIAILALSRPYDATVMAGSTGAMLLWLLWKWQTPIRTVCLRVGLPALVVLIVCAAVIAFNDYRVTGKPMTLPYQAHDRQYAVASMFTLAPLRREPVYHHPVMRQFWTKWNVAQWTDAHEQAGVMFLVKLNVLDTFFLPFWVLMIPVLLCPYYLTTTEERLTVLLLLVALLMIAPLIASPPHYVAAFAGVVYLRLLHSLARIWSWRPRGKPLGRGVVTALLALMLGALGNNLLGIIRNGSHYDVSGGDLSSQGIAVRNTGFGAARHSVALLLARKPGRQLVLVRYAPDHDPQNEWVYNRADIDASPVVWAREMGPEEDRPFIEYFRDRQLWLLEADQNPPRLRPYAGLELGPQ